MRYGPALAVALMATTGCSGSSFGYSGYNTHDYFAVDGDRTWKYVQDDDSLAWRMEVDKANTPRMVGDTAIYTFEYSIFDPSELLYSIDWSTDSVDGIVIHGFAVEGGESVSFATPVVISEPQMAPGEQIATATDGYSFTSTFTSTATCPNDWVTDDWDCLHFTISDGTDDTSSPPFVGDWWFAADWGTSRFNVPGYTSDWVLSEANWESLE
jgi:hypothetical protein